MKLKTLVASVVAIDRLVKTDLPVVLSFKLGKMLKEVEPVIQAYEDTRRKLINELGMADEKGDVRVTQENLSVFAEKLNVVLAEEVEVNDIPTVKVKDLKDIKMTAQDMAALSWLIKE